MHYQEGSPSPSYLNNGNSVGYVNPNDSNRNPYANLNDNVNSYGGKKKF